MFYAKLNDRNDRKNNCIAEFEEERARDRWCEEYSDCYGDFTWSPISMADAARYGLERFSDDAYEIGRGSDNRIVFAIDI